MKFSKSIVLFLIVSAVSLISPTFKTHTYAQEKTVTINFFWGNGCPHCEKEAKFLDTLQSNYPNVIVNKFEVSNNPKNGVLLQQIGKKFEVNVSGVPFTMIGKDYIIGYHSDETTGAQIKELVEYCSNKPECPDEVAQINQSTTNTSIWKEAPKSIPRQVYSPIFGNINLTALSLPLITMVLGSLDGFNPCAMWVLLFLISLLLNLEDKRRRWILGGTFILTSSLSYMFFMAAWLNILLFVGFIIWVRLGIALFAIGAGVMNLNKFRKHQTGCLVEKNENRKQIFEKLKKATFDKNLLVAIFGIITLAFAVNLVELLCSAGFPAIFTQILALNALPTHQYYLYIALYIFFFMLDDLVIFIIAMKTLETTGISTKYVKYSYLIGGILMSVIGVLLVVKPQYLSFSF